MTAGHTAIVTGANHGIGAATAQALAGRGCAVLCTFLRTDDPDDPGTPQLVRDHRAQDAMPVVAGIRDSGGRAAAVEADLSDPATSAGDAEREALQQRGRELAIRVQDELGTDGWEVLYQIDGQMSRVHPPGGWPVGSWKQELLGYHH